MPIQTALLGTGVFAKDVYAKLLNEFRGTLNLKYSYSRGAQGAEDFVAQHAQGATPVHGDQGLATVMQDPDVKLVVVVLPPHAALKAVQAALAAGKHVVEEKPIGPTSLESLEALKQYRQVVPLPPAASPAQGPLWLLAENYRYEEVFLEAANLVSSGALGSLIKLDLVCNMPLDSNNRYYASAWRRDVAGYPAGQILESSVHFMAALRLLARAGGLGEASQASGFARQTRADLNPPDTVVGTVVFPPRSDLSAQATGTGGAQAEAEGKVAPAPVTASVSISLAAAQIRWSLSAVGTKGALEVLRGGWAGNRGTYTLHKQIGSEPATSKSYGFSGTSREMASFLHLISQVDAAAGVDNLPALGGPLDPYFSGPQAGAGVPADQALPPPVLSTWADLHARSSPEEGLRDLALITALLESSGKGGAVVDVPQVAGPETYGVL